MDVYYYPVIACIIFAMGSVAQQAHTGHVVRGEHGGHGGQVIRRKISDTVEASIARATDPFGVSQGRRASTHGSHATHGEHGAHGVQTGHEGHGINGGSHGVQGHSSHGSDSKAGQGNHGHQKSDHTDHSQTSTRQDSAHGHGSTFKQIGHDIDSGRHSDHKTMVQDVMKSHELHVPKVKDGHSISEINAVSSHAGHTVPVSTAITEIGSHETHGEHGTHGTAIIGGSHGIQGHGSHDSNSNVGHDNHGIQKSDHTQHRQTITHQELAHGLGSNFEQIGQGIDSGMHSDHKTIVQDVTKLYDLSGHKVQDGQSISEINAAVSHAGHAIPTHTSIIKHDNTNNLNRDHEIHVHESVGRQNINADNITHEHSLSSQGTQDIHDRHGDGHTMPFHDTTLRHNVDHSAHRGNVKPSIENENHLPRLNAHEIHSGHSITSQSGSANPSRHIKIEGSETMADLEHKSRVSPSHDVHEVPTFKQSIQTEHGGHIIPTQAHSDKLAIWGNSKELNHGVHTPDANVRRISGTQSHLPSSLTELQDKRIIQSPSNVSNQWQHSNIPHISPKPQVHEAHGGHANFNKKNSRLPSDGTGSGVNKKVAEHGDHRMNDHLPNVMLMFNSVDPSAKDSTVNQHTGGHTMKNDTKRNHVDVLGTRQSNTQHKVDLVIPRTLEIHQAQHQLRKENIHTVTGLLEGLNAKKEASSNVELIGHIDPVEMELHDHPVDAHASSLDPVGVITVDPNLNVDRSRIHAESNLPNVNKGSGQNISIIHTTSQKSRVANSTASSFNLNNFLENINAELNNKGFGFVEPITSNSGVQSSIGQQRPSATKRQDNHNIPAHTGSSFEAGTVSNWGQGQGNIFTGFKNNRGMHDNNNRHQLSLTTPSPPIESTTVFVQQFSGEPTSMDSIFMRMFDPLTADMMLNRNVYPPVVDPFNDPRVPHNHGPMTSPIHNNGISIFDFFMGEF